ncbi:uncharacterized protein LOC110854217 [Folsomia candida]|uniref:Uncharacterized protein n=1 Tax=Folsomia candida TaxID=158441 RepID=A0A226DX29_FOLCA|nr:uncharacterized protein LOC110854217 [Folsomia candida]OXA50035.1 hypothetical protein Fcan01_14784 [Folsomia candida]
MDKIKNIKFTTARLTSQEGFLHFNHLIFSILTIIGLHITGELYDSIDTKGDYWTGALWGLFIGILGLVSLAIILCSTVVELPSFVLSMYYGCTAVFIFVFSSLGLGINKYVESYNDCMKENDSGIRCDYGFLVNRFIIYAISILHAMMYVVSMCIFINAKPEIEVTEGTISIMGDTTTTTSTTTKSPA